MMLIDETTEYARAVAALPHSAISGVVGGIWICVATVLGERLGGKWGGFLSGFPSTIVVACLFIGWTSLDLLKNVLDILPATFSGFGIFISAYWLSTKNEKIQRFGLVLAILIWLTVEVTILSLDIKHYGTSMLIWAITLSMGLWAIRSNPGKVHASMARGLSLQKTIFRCAIGFIVIFSAVLGSKVGGPHWGAILASLPASAFSTLYLLERDHGPQYARTFARSMMLSGLLNVVMFTSLLRLFLQVLELEVAVGLSLLITGVFALILFLKTNLYS